MAPNTTALYDADGPAANTFGAAFGRLARRPETGSFLGMVAVFVFFMAMALLAVASRLHHIRRGGACPALVPTALSPGSRYGLIALSAAFSITMIMTGVANTGGSAESLNRLARCSA